MAYRNKKGERKEGDSLSLLGKISFALDAVSYIIAFFIVDTLTFGAPPPLNITLTDHETLSSPLASPKHLQPTLPRRSVSEGDAYITPRRMVQHFDRSNNQSEGGGLLAAAHEHTMILEKEKLNNTSPSPHRQDFDDRSLHHYQKKIFSKQVKRTLLMQPLIKVILSAMIVGLFFILLAVIFGVPHLVKLAAEALREWCLSKPYQALLLLMTPLYKGILAQLPLPRKQQTGWEVIKSFYSHLWLQLSALLSW